MANQTLFNTLMDREMQNPQQTQNVTAASAPIMPVPPLPAPRSADVNIQKAMDMLRDDERPTFPIEVVDPDPQKFPIFRSAPKTAAIADRPNKRIVVNRASPEYADPIKLAAALAHEQSHVIKADQGLDYYDEVGPYHKQLEVLERLRYPDKAYMKAFRAEVIRREEMAKEEAKQKARTQK